MGLVTARTRDGPLLGGRGCELQQFGQRGCARLMHGRPHRHFHSFQVQTPGFVPAVEDDAQQLVYLARDFPMNRFGRFFPWALSAACSTGRRRQIFSLISTKARPNSRYLRNSAISCSAFRTAAEVGSASLTVLPRTL